MKRTVDAKRGDFRVWVPWAVNSHGLAVAELPGVITVVFDADTTDGPATVTATVRGADGRLIPDPLTGTALRATYRTHVRLVRRAEVVEEADTPAIALGDPVKNVPTPDDVFTGIIARLKADAGYKAQIPGGAWFGRRAAQKVWPYLVGTIEERGPEYQDSSGAYLQVFVVELTVWCQSADQAAAQTGPARAWLDGLLNWTPADPASQVVVPNAVATHSVEPAGGSLKLNPELRRGADVLAAGKRIEVTVEGNTSAA